MDFRLDEEILVELGHRAQTMRLQFELDQKKLAKKAGVSRDTIQRFERSGAITLANLIKVARVLDVLPHIDQIFSAPAYSPRASFKAESVKKRQRAFAPRKPRKKRQDKDEDRGDS